MKFLLLVLLSLTTSKFLGQVSIVKSDIREVHLIPHSHDDVGWLNTVEEIYQRGPGVKNIISSYVDALQKNPDRKFIQVETYYFKKWWNEQNDFKKSVVRKLIANGQLEFACGGLVMNDEAAAYYEDILDQLTAGHHFLFSQFNTLPKVGWQIDPFGHSNANSIIHFSMGFDSQFFARVDYKDKERRMKDKDLELIHVPENKYPIFTHITYFHYSNPPGYDFDVQSYTRSPQVTDQNLESRAQSLVEYFDTQFKHYRGNVISHTLGDDNQWSNAEYQFENLEKLLTYINERTEVFNMILKFSTPNQYIQKVAREELTYNTQHGDFFPYADKREAFWTGYFTSRVSFKYQIRTTGQYYQIAKSYFALRFDGQDKKQQDKISKALEQLSDMLGVMQHHDAVTGTAKQYVTDDYKNILYKAQQEVDQQFFTLISKDTKQQIYEDVNEFYRCNFNTTNPCLLNDALESGKVVLLSLINSPSLLKSDKLTFKVPKKSLTIIDQQNTKVEGDIICSHSDTNCNIFLRIDPNSSYLKIYTDNSDSASVKIIDKFKTINESSNIRFEGRKSFILQYYFYTSQTIGQNDGPYIFRPAGDKQSYGNFMEGRLYEGKVVNEIYIIRDTIKTWIRDWKHQQNIFEIETFVDSIQQGRDVVMTVDTGINSNDEFYTDSNGMHLQNRKLNFRETWQFESTERITENYYPINAFIGIQDRKKGEGVALINDRAQGGTSLKSGQLEIMLHRRTVHDDGRGVGDVLNEMENLNTPLTQNIFHQLVFYTDINAVRQQQYFRDTKPLLFFAQSADKTFKKYEILSDIKEDLLKIKLIGQQNPLGKIILQRMDDNEYLVRLHNMQETGNLAIQWPNHLTKRETTWNGKINWNDWIKNRINWYTDQQINLDSGDVNNLEPQQLRTFVVSI